MEIFTERNLIKGVADKWRLQYPKGCSEDKESTWKNLCALDADVATAEEVNKIIGNGSWTSRCCDECGEDKGAVVQLGQEPDYESCTALICKDCLNKAVALIEGQSTNKSEDGKC